MAINLSSTYYASIDEMYRGKQTKNRLRVRGLTPITYSPLTGWFLLNYSFLICLIALPVTVAWGVVSLF